MRGDYGNGVLNDFLVNGSQLFCDVGRPILLHWSVFFIAVGMISLSHVRACGVLEGRRELNRWLNYLAVGRSDRTMWEALVVLHFYFDPSRPLWTYEYPFAISITFIFVETLLFFLIRAMTDTERDTAKTTDYFEQNDSNIHNKYMDISYKFRRALLYFWVQSALICYFVFWLNGDEQTKDLANVSILKWIVAVNLSMTAGEQDDVGVPFTIGYWKMLMRRGNTNINLDGDGSRLGCRFFRSPRDLWFRCFMDCLVNGFARSMLMALAPVALSVEEKSINFIKDALALYFVTKLDDMQPPKTLEESLKDLKAEEEKLEKDGFVGKSLANVSRYEPWMVKWLEGLEQARAEEKTLPARRRGYADNRVSAQLEEGNAVRPAASGDEDDETTALTNNNNNNLRKDNEATALTSGSSNLREDNER